MEVQLPLQGEIRFNPPVGSSTRSGDGISPEPRSICILRLSSIGDVIHTLPVVDLLKKRYPGTRITWIAEKAMAPLLNHHPNLDQLLLVDTGHWRRRFLSPHAWKEVIRFVRYFRAQKFDLALDFQGLFKSAALARLSGARRRIGMSRRDRRERWSGIFLNEFSHHTLSRQHIIEKNLAVLEKLDISSGKEPLNFHIHPDPESLETIEKQLGKLELERFILVNPGGGWITKQWGPKKFAALIDAIYSDLGIPAIVLWGPGERPLAEKVVRECLSPAAVSFETNLSDLIALLKRAFMMISGDSGPLHLAAALGVPAVGVYGPTDPERNGPWNPQDSVCTIHYECSPCYQRTCPIGVQCLKRLEVGPVLDAVKRTLTLSHSLSQNQ